MPHKIRRKLFDRLRNLYNFHNSRLSTLHELFGSGRGVGSGSLCVASAFFVSGVLTYVFQSVSARYLGPEGYGSLAILWSATFLTVQIAWIWASQTLGRFIAESELRSEGSASVVASVQRLQLLTLAVFLTLALVLGPFATNLVFGGEVFLYVAFVVAVAAYAPEYFARGVFSGRRLFARLGALHVVESLNRAVISLVLLFFGAGIFGPVVAIILAPLVGVALIHPARVRKAGRESRFGAWEAARFAVPVVFCIACGQAFMNGGPILLVALGASRAEVGVFLAALITARIPQYVLSPAVSSLLPHASRALETNGPRALDRFLLISASLTALIGVFMVAGAWIFGESALRLLYGPGFEAPAMLLTTLAALAALFLLSEVVSQALFALDRERLAALGWASGLPVALACLFLIPAPPVERVSFSLVAGVLSAFVSQTLLYLAAIRNPRA